MYKNTRWAQQLIAAQLPDGSWGSFHSLSHGAAVSTESALRRLHILGYTAQDACIAKALGYMHSCLLGQTQLPDPREKLHDWDVFTQLMLSTWISMFTRGDPAAEAVGQKWAQIIAEACQSGAYSQQSYAQAYARAWGMRPRGGRLVDCVNFYPVALLAGRLDAPVQRAFIAHVLAHPQGMYYIYEAPLAAPPPFAGKAASRYLRAVELLARYPFAGEQLGFVKQWLLQNRVQDGRWDLGSAAGDKVYLPRADNWRKKDARIEDCTQRITALLERL